MTLTTHNSPRVDFRPFEAEIATQASQWTQSKIFARENPNGLAITSDNGDRTFVQLHENANRLANALQVKGLKPGDGVAMMCRNRPEFVEVFLACMRIGLRLTPINSHLTATEATYILSNSEAKAFFLESGLIETPQQHADAPPVWVIEVGGESRPTQDSPSADSYSQLLTSSSIRELAPSPVGKLMLYTSGTTGKPKGVISDSPEITHAQYSGSFANFDPSIDTNLCCGPAYHAGPLLFDVRWPLASGVPIVLMDKWNSEAVVDAMSRNHVTHAHMVTTMFQRLLQLPADLRAKRHLSKLRSLIHGAAPCPIPIKRAMIDWLGPVLFEYYGATEGGNGINVASEQWLQKPGTVGRMDPSLGHRVLRDDGTTAATGEVGKIFFKAPSTSFSYFKDPEKTARAYQGDAFTLGDLGYIDEDGYLFLTGRVAECIITGGVNVYPQEVDDALAQHPFVLEACTVGAPDPEWGERVISLVVLRDTAPQGDHTATLLSFAATHLASFKRPKTIIFARELPRTATGKLLRQQVRQRFWPTDGRTI